MRAAILSSATAARDDAAARRCFATSPAQGNAAPPAMVEPLLSLAGSQPNRAPIELITRTIGEPAGQGGRYAPWQFATLAGLLDARDRARQPLEPRSRQAVRGGLGSGPPRGRRRLGRRGRAARRPSSSSAYGARRNAKDRDLLVGLLRPQVPVGAPASGRGRPRRRIRRPQGRRPAARRLEEILAVRSAAAILDTLLSRTRVDIVVAFVARRRLRPAGRDRPGPAPALLTRRSTGSGRAPRPSSPIRAKPRQAVVDAYRAALGIKGDQAAGAAVFKKLCASCHRLGKEGRRGRPRPRHA